LAFPKNKLTQKGLDNFIIGLNALLNMTEEDAWNFRHALNEAFLEHSKTTQLPDFLKEIFELQ
jgi:hypothetical protein